MRRLKCIVMLVSLLICLSLLIWKAWTTFTLEVEVYSRVQTEHTARRRIISRCKAFEERRDLRKDPKAEVEHPATCAAGSVSQSGQCAPCPKGMFSFPGWISCDKHLDCDQMRYDLRIVKDSFVAGNWQFKAAEWRGYQVLYAITEKEHSIDEDTISELFPASAVLQPIGFCAQTGGIVFTQSSQIKGTANELNSLLSKNPKCDSWIVRFRLAIDFVRELTRLHSTSIVVCNSHSLEQTLQQLAITEHWELFLSTFDNLQQRKRNSLVRCSDKELKGAFVAPEQLWPYAGTKVFNIQQQPGYTEASDVWKIPDITQAILGSSKKAQSVFDYLSLIHHICKSSDPQSRPTATEVLRHYEEVWSLLVN